MTRIVVARVEAIAGRCYGGFVTKDDLHALVDALPNEAVDAAGVLLRRAQDPVVAKLDAAAYDDEPLTAEDLEAIEQARREPAVAFEQSSAELETD